MDGAVRRLEYPLRRSRRIALLAVLAGALLGPSSRADGDTNHVKDLKLEADDTKTMLEVVGTSAPTYNVRIDDGGNTLVVDLAHADLAGTPPAITSPKGLVGG